MITTESRRQKNVMVLNWGFDMADEEETKRIVKEALREWLDEKYAEFGRWSIHGILAALLAATVVLVFWSQGWHK